MIIGVPKEIKTLENRIAMTPGGVETMVRRGTQSSLKKTADWAVA